MCELPFFSVIIPTYNRPRLLRVCVASVMAQTYPADRYEVIVVDDGGRGGVARLLASYIEDGRVRYLRQRRQGWGAARLLGAWSSRGEVLAFIDDDCAAPEGWLACYAGVYAAHPEVDGVGGGLWPAGRMNVAGWKQYVGHLARFDRLNGPLGIRVDQAGRVWFTFGGNRTFRRAVWLAAQAEAPVWWYYDDYVIDLRLRAMGACIYYEPAAWVAHHYVLGVAQRVRAAYRYGRSEVVVRAPLGAPTGTQAMGDRVGLLGKWRRLAREAPGSSGLERAWYAATQPFVWAARRAGRSVQAIRLFAADLL